MTPRRISLRIGELVLHGIADADREEVGSAVRSEVARLLAQGGVPAAWLPAGGADPVDAGTVALPAGARPAELGARVAQAVVSWPGPGRDRP